MKIEKIIHSFFKIKWNDQVIYIDPFSDEGDVDLSSQPDADFVFISHEHFDHCDVESIKEIMGEDTKIYGNSLVVQKLKEEGISVNVVEPDMKYLTETFEFYTTPAYNIDKYKNEDEVYHPKENNGVGFILELDNKRIYHMGDTDNIEELSNVEKIDIALVPVSGTYVMTWEEAVDAMELVSPDISIPMHYGAIIGDEEDAISFQEKYKGNVEILS